MAYLTASSLAPDGGDDGLTIEVRNAVADFEIVDLWSHSRERRA